MSYMDVLVRVPAKRNSAKGRWFTTRPEVSRLKSLLQKLQLDAQIIPVISRQISLQPTGRRLKAVAPLKMKSKTMARANNALALQGSTIQRKPLMRTTPLNQKYPPITLHQQNILTTNTERRTKAVV